MKWSRRVAHWLGYELNRVKTPLTLAGQLANVLRRLKISLVLDVGANVGQYGQNLRHLGYRGQICSFEPVSASFQALSEVARRDGKWQVHPLALGAREQELEIRVAADSQMCSFRDPNAYAAERFPEMTTVIGHERVRVSTLDAFFAQHPGLASAGPTFLKMDTQGYDLEVFAGGQSVIPSLAGLQSELSLRPIYDGMPHYLRALETYEKAGFCLTGLYPISRDDRGLALIEVDCVMIRPEAVPAD